MKQEKIQITQTTLTEEDCCKLYIEIREMKRDKEWVEHNPKLSELMDFLHSKYEGKAYAYHEEYHKLWNK